MSVQPATAQAAAAFFKGKTIELGISSSVGGGYDAHARMLARHMGQYIPGNPRIVPKNLEGAGGLRLANLLYNTAPRDGTSLGTIYRATAFEPLFGNKAAQFDATQFTWIGSASSEVSLCVSWHTSGVADFARQQIAYPFLAPPGVPADRVDVLRVAFLKAMADPELLAEARKARLEIMPVAGDEVQKLVGKLYATPAATVHKTMQMLN